MFTHAYKGVPTSRVSEMKKENRNKNQLAAILEFDLWVLTNFQWYSSRIIKSTRPIIQILVVLNFGVGLFILHEMSFHESITSSSNFHLQGGESDEVMTISDASISKNYELQSELNRLKRKTSNLELLIRRMDSQLRILHSHEKIHRMPPDFASEAAGGSILGTPETESYLDSKQIQTTIFGIPICKPSFFTPRKVIQPWSEPGECWAFHGSNGNVEIELAHSAYLDRVTLEHIEKSASLTGSIDSAPREFRVLGKFQDKYVVLGTFEYNDRGESSQSFYFKKQEMRNLPLKIIMLQILSNWGNPEYTCVYRFRAHGRIFDPLAF